MGAESSRPGLPDPDTGDQQAVDRGDQTGRTPAAFRRAQRLPGRVRAGVAATGEWLEDRRRQGDKRVDYALSAFERDRSNGGVVLSGAVAFRLFLFFVPFVVFIVLVLGAGSTPTSSNHDAARRMGIGGLIAKAAGGTNHLSGVERLTSTVVVGVAVLYGARALYRVLFIVYSLEWSRPIKRVKPTRPALLLIAFAFACLGAELGLSRLRAASPIGGPIGTIFLFFLLPTAFWLGALQYLPHDSDCPWWAEIPGALVIAVGVEVVHLFTVYWVARQLQRKSEVYGALGGSLDILLWAYVIGRVIVLGAVINSLLWERHGSVTERDRYGPVPTDADQPGGPQ